MEISGFLVLIIGGVAVIAHGIGYQRGRISGWKYALRMMELAEKQHKAEEIKRRSVQISPHGQESASTSMRPADFQDGKRVIRNKSNS